MMTYNLKPDHGGTVSFYGKANVHHHAGVFKLQSYETIVCSYDEETGKFTKLWDGYSATTMRHVNEFRLQAGLPVLCKHEWLALPVESKEG